MKDVAGRWAFTLLEVLIATAVLLCLVGLLLPVIRGVLSDSKEAKAINHFRQLGVAVATFAADNESNLPLRLASGELWPAALIDYLDGDENVYAEPNSTVNFRTLNVDPLDSTINRTSYILNSFRDLGDRARKIVNIAQPSSTILMAVQQNSSGFYMDLDRNDHMRFVNPEQYGQGAYYLFVDGSARYVVSANYAAILWMAEKSLESQK